MNQDNMLAPNKIMVGEHLYNEAISLILSNAQHELLIFDQDLSHGNFASLEKYELFQQFLSRNVVSHLSIILQNTDFFQAQCPRLFSLLKTFSHKMTVHVTDDTAKHAKDCFILADGQHYIKRIHIDQARFKYALNDSAGVEVLNVKFKELKEAIGDVVTITALGL